MFIKNLMLFYKYFMSQTEENYLETHKHAFSKDISDCINEIQLLEISENLQKNEIDRVLTKIFIQICISPSSYDKKKLCATRLMIFVISKLNLLYTFANLNTDQRSKLTFEELIAKLNGQDQELFEKNMIYLIPYLRLIVGLIMICFEEEFIEDDERN